MIKTLTPYYISIPLTNPNTSLVCESYTVKIYVWNGNKTAVPSSSSYEITKINASGLDGTDKINIARIINDYINFVVVESATTSLENGNNQVWVKFESYYSDEPTVPQNYFTTLAVKGYGYFLDGENPQSPANKILLTGDEFKVNRNGFFVMPIRLFEPTPPVSEIVIDIVTYNYAEDTESSINIFYTINAFTPSDVVVQESTDNITFSDLYTLPNASPLNDVIISYAPLGYKWVRLKITELGTDYFSNTVDIGIV